MKEKRKLPRRHLAYYLMVFDREADELMGYLVDISGDGIMVITQESVDPNTVFHLRMIFPAKIGGRRHLDFDAKSLWCRDDVKAGYYHSGLEFLDVSQEDRDTIELLIDEFGSRD